MYRHSRIATRLSCLALLTVGAIACSSIAMAADTPPAPAAPGNDPNNRHHNPAWAACKKQADDQKLEPGDARHEFMRNCLKSAHGAAPAAP